MCVRSDSRRSETVLSVSTGTYVVRDTFYQDSWIVQWSPLRDVIRKRVAPEGQECRCAVDCSDYSTDGRVSQIKEDFFILSVSTGAAAASNSFIIRIMALFKWLDHEWGRHAWSIVLHYLCSAMGAMCRAVGEPGLVLHESTVGLWKWMLHGSLDDCAPRFPCVQLQDWRCASAQTAESTHICCT
jgi:hypothetical protein